jgi:hypothetical protein
MRRYQLALVLVFIFLWCVPAFAQSNACVEKISGEEKTNIIISLEVKGLKNYSDFLYLKEFLKKRAKIVKNICSRSFEWQQVHLELEISGTAQALAVELAKTGRYILVDTEQIKKNQIVISLLQEGGEQ